MRVCPKTLLAVALLSLAAGAAGQDLPRLSQTIALPGVEGRIDHLAVDVKGQRLFVAALGNNTLEVVDLREGKRLQTLAGLAGPQGAAYDPESGRLFVTSGQSGRLDVFESTPLRRVQSVPVGDDADNVRLDAGRRQVVVGYGSGALAILDPRDGRSLGDVTSCPAIPNPSSWKRAARESSSTCRARTRSSWWTARKRPSSPSGRSN